MSQLDNNNESFLSEKEQNTVKNSAENGIPSSNENQSIDQTVYGENLDLNKANLANKFLYKDYIRGKGVTGLVTFMLLVLVFVLILLFKYFSIFYSPTTNEGWLYTNFYNAPGISSFVNAWNKFDAKAFSFLPDKVFSLFTINNVGLTGESLMGFGLLFLVLFLILVIWVSIAVKANKKKRIKLARQIARAKKDEYVRQYNAGELPVRSTIIGPSGEVIPLYSESERKEIFSWTKYTNRKPVARVTVALILLIFGFFFITLRFLYSFVTPLETTRVATTVVSSGNAAIDGLFANSFVKGVMNIFNYLEKSLESLFGANAGKQVVASNVIGSQPLTMMDISVILFAVALLILLINVVVGVMSLGGTVINNKKAHKLAKKAEEEYLKKVRDSDPRTVTYDENARKNRQMFVPSNQTKEEKITGDIRDAFSLTAVKRVFEEEPAEKRAYIEANQVDLQEVFSNDIVEEEIVQPIEDSPIYFKSEEEVPLEYVQPLTKEEIVPMPPVIEDTFPGDIHTIGTLQDFNGLEKLEDDTNEVFDSSNRAIYSEALAEEEKIEDEITDTFRFDLEEIAKEPLYDRDIYILNAIERLDYQRVDDEEYPVILEEDQQEEFVAPEQDYAPEFDDEVYKASPASADNYVATFDPNSLLDDKEELDPIYDMDIYTLNAIERLNYERVPLDEYPEIPQEEEEQKEEFIAPEPEYVPEFEDDPILETNFIPAEESLDPIYDMDIYTLNAIERLNYERVPLDEYPDIPQEEEEQEEEFVAPEPEYVPEFEDDPVLEANFIPSEESVDPIYDMDVYTLNAIERLNYERVDDSEYPELPQEEQEEVFVAPEPEYVPEFDDEPAVESNILPRARMLSDDENLNEIPSQDEIDEGIEWLCHEDDYIDVSIARDYVPSIVDFDTEDDYDEEYDSNYIGQDDDPFVLEDVQNDFDYDDIEEEVLDELYDNDIYTLNAIERLKYERVEDSEYPLIPEEENEETFIAPEPEYVPEFEEEPEVESNILPRARMLEDDENLNNIPYQYDIDEDIEWLCHEDDYIDESIARDDDLSPLPLQVEESFDDEVLDSNNFEQVDDEIVPEEIVSPLEELPIEEEGIYDKDIYTLNAIERLDYERVDESEYPQVEDEELLEDNFDDNTDYTPEFEEDFVNPNPYLYDNLGNRFAGEVLNDLVDEEYLSRDNQRMRAYVPGEVEDLDDTLYLNNLRNTEDDYQTFIFKPKVEEDEYDVVDLEMVDPLPPIDIDVPILAGDEDNQVPSQDPIDENIEWLCHEDDYIDESIARDYTPSSHFVEDSDLEDEVFEDNYIDQIAEEEYIPNDYEDEVAPLEMLEPLEEEEGIYDMDVYTLNAIERLNYERVDDEEYPEIPQVDEEQEEEFVAPEEEFIPEFEDEPEVESNIIPRSRLLAEDDNLNELPNQNEIDENIEWLCHEDDYIDESIARDYTPKPLLTNDEEDILEDLEPNYLSDEESLEDEYSIVDLELVEPLADEALFDNDLPLQDQIDEVVDELGEEFIPEDRPALARSITPIEDEILDDVDEELIANEFDQDLDEDEIVDEEEVEPLFDAGDDTTVYDEENENPYQDEIDEPVEELLDEIPQDEDLQLSRSITPDNEEIPKEIFDDEIVPNEFSQESDDEPVIDDTIVEEEMIEPLFDAGDDTTVYDELNDNPEQDEIDEPIEELLDEIPQDEYLQLARSITPDNEELPEEVFDDELIPNIFDQDGVTNEPLEEESPVEEEIVEPLFDAGDDATVYDDLNDNPDQDEIDEAVEELLDEVPQDEDLQLARSITPDNEEVPEEIFDDELIPNDFSQTSDDELVIDNSIVDEEEVEPLFDAGDDTTIYDDLNDNPEQEEIDEPVEELLDEVPQDEDLQLARSITPDNEEVPEEVIDDELIPNEFNQESDDEPVIDDTIVDEEMVEPLADAGDDTTIFDDNNTNPEQDEIDEPVEDLLDEVPQDEDLQLARSITPDNEEIPDEIFDDELDPNNFKQDSDDEPIVDDTIVDEEEVEPLFDAGDDDTVFDEENENPLQDEIDEPVEELLDEVPQDEDLQLARSITPDNEEVPEEVIDDELIPNEFKQESDDEPVIDDTIVDEEMVEPLDEDETNFSPSQDAIDENVETLEDELPQDDEETLDDILDDNYEEELPPEETEDLEINNFNQDTPIDDELEANSLPSQDAIDELVDPLENEVTPEDDSLLSQSITPESEEVPEEIIEDRDKNNLPEQTLLPEDDDAVIVDSPLDESPAITPISPISPITPITPINPISPIEASPNEGPAPQKLGNTLLHPITERSKAKNIKPYKIKKVRYDLKRYRVNTDHGDISPEEAFLKGVITVSPVVNPTFGSKDSIPLWKKRQAEQERRDMLKRGYLKNLKNTDILNKDDQQKAKFDKRPSDFKTLREYNKAKKLFLEEQAKKQENQQDNKLAKPSAPLKPVKPIDITPNDSTKEETNENAAPIKEEQAVKPNNFVKPAASINKPKGPVSPFKKPKKPLDPK